MNQLDHKMEDTFIKLLEGVNEFSVDNHDKIEGALIIIVAGKDSEQQNKDKTATHESLVLTDGNPQVIAQALSVIIEQIPELVDIFASAVMNAGLEGELNKALLLFKIKKNSLEKIAELVKRKEEK